MISCGHCNQGLGFYERIKGHETVAAMRAHAEYVKMYGEGNVWRCEWLRQDGWTEDGEAYIVECGAPAHETDRGWTCFHNHKHVRADVRFEEGWDYAEDEFEAKRLRGLGIDCVGMDGGSI